MGDSITALWWLPTSNLGVSGNTTTQMLARYGSDVPGHQYKVLVILGGTNDVRLTTSPIEDEVNTSISDIEQMASMAESEGIEVVLCTIPPILNRDSRVEALNAAIQSLAAEHHYKLVDYYTPMAGHREYFRDGEHPNDHGYLVMKGALTQVIALND